MKRKICLNSWVDRQKKIKRHQNLMRKQLAIRPLYLMLYENYKTYAFLQSHWNNNNIRFERQIEWRERDKRRNCFAFEAAYRNDTSYSIKPTTKRKTTTKKLWILEKKKNNTNFGTSKYPESISMMSNEEYVFYYRSTFVFVQIFKCLLCYLIFTFVRLSLTLSILFLENVVWKIFKLFKYEKKNTVPIVCESKQKSEIPNDLHCLHRNSQIFHYSSFELKSQTADPTIP